MAFIFIFIDHPPKRSCYYKKDFLVVFSLAVVGFPLEPGQDVLWWSSMWKGEEGRQLGMTLTPISSHTLPGASHIHSGKEEASLYSS